MFLFELKIWNFRKYGSGDGGAPGLYLKLNKGLNLFVDENDSGKTAIGQISTQNFQKHNTQYKSLENLSNFPHFFLKPEVQSKFEEIIIMQQLSLFFYTLLFAFFPFALNHIRPAN